MTGDQAALHARHATLADQSTDAVAAPAITAAVEMGEPSLRHAWQIPTMLMSAALIAWGLYGSYNPATAPSMEAAIVEAEHLFASGDAEQGLHQLKTLIEPNLHRATEAEQARFHALIGDYLASNRHRETLDRKELGSRTAESYQKALELGMSLSPQRLEHLITACLDAGKIDEATAGLRQLDELSISPGVTDMQAQVRAIRSRVLRQLLEHRIVSGQGSIEEEINLLSEYRRTPELMVEDDLWAIARQTELRLRAGHAQAAIDLLLVEMRRLELRGAATDPAIFGPLYVLLGRGYFEVGDYERARRHLEHALTLLKEYELPRAEALVMLGHVTRTLGDPVTALEYFQIVVQDFAGTPHYFAGLLGRGETLSIMGDHAGSMADYRTLASQRVSSMSGDQLRKLIASLCDRCDASISTSRLDEALEYIQIAEQVAGPEHPPRDVLLRLASVHRQLADDVIARATAAATLDVAGDLDGSMRQQANIHYRNAANYYVRLSQGDTATNDGATEPAPTVADSQWLAADCFDLGGQQDRAIEQFTRYLQMHSIEDPRRAETLFRLAQAHHAIGQHAEAAHQYELLIADRSRTRHAIRSYVPLAQCYVALGNNAQAKQLLQEVISGDRLLQPDSMDYRQALLELGRIEFQQDAFPAAIEALSEFLERYPNDGSIVHVRYLLAEAYRRNAVQIQHARTEGGASSGAEPAANDDMAQGHFELAMLLYSQVAESLSGNSDAAARPDIDMIRRANLYRGDCAFQLQNYAQAIEYYDEAARKFSTHESSMYALIQIVHCYRALGDDDRASAAHHRAMMRLQQLPASAFDSPDSLMNRAAWEQWLEEHPVGSALAGAAGT